MEIGRKISVDKVYGGGMIACCPHSEDQKVMSPTPVCLLGIYELLGFSLTKFTSTWNFRM
jgi:hypothetical protein